MTYFEELATLLEKEQKHDKEEYQQLLQTQSLAKRRQAGLCWYPIMIRNEEIGLGDYIQIIIQRTVKDEQTHRFRYGMPVALFSNHNPSADRISGIIGYVNGDEMKISLRVDELPDWVRSGKLGVDLLFDENSYQEMFKALKRADAARDDKRMGPLINLLIDQQVHDYDHAVSDQQINSITGLNEYQLKAVNQIIASPHLTIVHGPPGTGKTTTLVQGIKALLQKYPDQILVTAPSNTAVDLLTEKLHETGVKVVRIGNPVKVSEQLHELTLDGKLESHPMQKELKTIRKKADVFRDMAKKYKRNFGKAERDQRKALFQEAKNLMKEAEQIAQYIQNDILDQAQVITATLVGSNHSVIQDRTYAAVFIDEAGQALEPACWIPILKSDKLILAGDHLQLPPTIKSKDSLVKAFQETLMEKLVYAYPSNVSLLRQQYRMHQDIMQYPSAALYNNTLFAEPLIAQQELIPGDKAFLFIDTAGAGFDELQEDTAISNAEEANFLIRHLKQYLTTFKRDEHINQFPKIGLISPYRQQVMLLKELIGSEMWAETAVPIQVQTIDGFQGQERDIIYISLTRSNAEGQIGFLNEIRRMNVAMTRARYKLVIIGDSSTIGQHPFYAGMIQYAESIDSYKSVWEWM
ncbi:AAA domain-containing protein [Sphingobacterium spiritivorum]|uniref:AAA domain-containing protein n=1 Tax=Sphingobacterium spiritivorum TaxID=258 RepID=UPI0019186C3A|nr:AAA domain-containing protein [Sphingobacterium spiritivorum]QQT25361.1 AAA family ATPase [Sphingobacterium spiritivorum]